MVLQVAGMRSIWNGALAAVAIANSIFADKRKALEKDAIN